MDTKIAVFFRLFFIHFHDFLKKAFAFSDFFDIIYNVYL